MTNELSHMNKKTASPSRDFIYTVPSKIMHDNDLSLNDMKVYMIVRSFMDTTGSCYASNNWIASDLGIHRTTVIDCIKKLIKKNYLVRSEVNGQRYLAVNYTPILEEVVVSTLPPSSLETTPPSSLETTQYNTNIINTKTNNTHTAPPLDNFSNNEEPILDPAKITFRSEEHTSELQSQSNLV